MQNLIIYEDEVLLVVNKPSGLPAQGTDDPRKQHLYGLLLKYLAERDKKKVYLAIHHRLDAVTSGLMIFCKDQNYNKAFTDLFRDQKIEKTYLAKVQVKEGAKLADEFSVENNLKAVQRGKFKISIADSKGDAALTEFKVLEREGDTALLECSPRTGRMHQIRVHLADLKLPVIGDFVYGGFKKSNAFHLHAWKLRFPHPKSREIVEYVAPISWGKG
jgi:RluA family pseudouridine synthase